MLFLLKIGKWSAILLVLMGIAFRLWPPLASQTVWRACAGISLGAMSLAALGQLPHFVLGWLMAPRGRRLIRRLARVDFWSEVSALRRLLYALPIALLALAAARVTGLLAYALVWGALLLAPELYFLTQRMTPPLALYLGASEPHDPMREASLMSTVLVGRRLVTLLRPDQRGLSPSYTRLLSYRTRERSWLTVLDELLEIAPIVAVDFRAVTLAVRLELARISTCRLFYKTVVLVDPEQTQVQEGALAVVIEGGGVCLTSYDAFTYVLRAFCHPHMPPPEEERSIAALVGDLRRANPGVDFAVWGQEIPPPRDDTIPGKHYRVW